MLEAGKIKKSVALRKGECNQCGECCKFAFECPMLFKMKGKYACRIYRVRPTVCRLFPLTHHDVLTVESKCDYYWHKKDIKKLRINL